LHAVEILNYIETSMYLELANLVGHTVPNLINRLKIIIRWKRLFYYHCEYNTVNLRCCMRI